MDTGRAFSLGSCCSVLAGRQARSVCTFSQDGFGLETDRGSLSLQSVSNDSISPHRIGRQLSRFFWMTDGLSELWESSFGCPLFTNHNAQKCEIAQFS